VAGDAGEPAEGRRIDVPRVAPGETQWVRNLRAAGGGRLRLGRRTAAFTAAEVTGVDAVRVLRPYLGRWWLGRSGRFFDGVGADASDEELWPSPAATRCSR
jgi:hypothetical protein